MPIYKLTPLSTSTADWERSVHHGEAIIRAESEKDARAIAAFSFGIAKKVTPGESVTWGPWRDDGAVRSETITDERFPEAGPRTVLVPREWSSVVPFTPVA
jgi:hypothetical protein